MVRSIMDRTLLSCVAGRTVRIARLLCSIIAVVGSGLGASPLQAQPVERFEISGRVGAAATGQPIHRARISILRNTDRKVLATLFSGEDGTFHVERSISVATEVAELPGLYRLGGIYPNPVSGRPARLWISYVVPGERPEHPEAEVFDVLGRRVHPDESLAAGMYLVRLRFERGTYSESRPFVLLERAKLILVLEQSTAVAATRAGTSSAAKASLDAVPLDAILLVERSGFISHEREVRLESESDNSFQVSLEAAPNPTAAFEVGGPLVAGEAAYFDATASFDPDGVEMAAYSWEFGNGRRAGGARVSHIFTEGGTFTISLTVASRYGATATTAQIVEVAPAPRPSDEDGRITGLVEDVEGRPILDATVRLLGGTVSGRTDASGQVTLEGLPRGLPITLEVTRPGYAIQRVRQTIPPADELNFMDGYFETRLLQREPALTLEDVELGGTVIGRDGASIELPVEGMRLVDGTIATGPVQVSISPVDVADASGLRAFPGEFAGITPDGPAHVILSYGTAEYVFTRNGQPLRLAPGKTAVVEIPIYVREHVDGRAIRTGDVGPLWSLDEELGIWVQEGEGIVVPSAASPTGLALRGEVTHLSWWNHDVGPRAPRPVIVPRPYAVPRPDNPQWCDPQNREAWCRSPFMERRYGELCHEAAEKNYTALFELWYCGLEDGMERLMEECETWGNPEVCGSGKSSHVPTRRVQTTHALRQEDGDFNGNGLPWDDEDWALFCDGNPFCEEEAGSICDAAPSLCSGATLRGEPIALGSDGRARGPVGSRVETNVPPDGEALFVPPDQMIVYTAIAAGGLLRGRRTTRLSAGEQPRLVIPMFIFDPAGGRRGELSCGAWQTGTIETVADADVWTFHGTAGVSIILFAYPAAGSSLRGTATLRDPGGTQRSRWALGPRPQIVSLEATGSYELVIEASDGVPDLYSVELECASGAGLATLGGELTGNLYGPKIYAFEGRQGEPMNAALLAAAELFRGVRLELYDPAGEMMRWRSSAAVAGFGAEYVQTDILELPSDGLYWIRFHAEDPLSRMPVYSEGRQFTLGLSRIGEPLPIVIDGSSARVQGEIPTLGGSQFYRFMATEGAWYNLALTHPPGSSLNAVAWIRSRPEEPFYGGTPLPGSIATGTSSAQRGTHSGPAVFAEGGEHVIEVFVPAHIGGASPESRVGSFELALNAPQPHVGALDALAEATFTARSFNVFPFEGTEGEFVNIALLPVDFSSRYVGRLKAPSGNEITFFGGQTSGYAESGVWALRETGRHDVVIYTPNTEDRSGDFLFAIPRISPPSVLALQSPSVSIPGEIDLIGRRSYFRFEGTEGDSHNFVIRHPAGSELNARITLRRPGSEPFYSLPPVRSAATTGGARVAATGAVTLPANGEYVLEVQSASGTATDEHTGAFEVAVEE